MLRIGALALAAALVLTGCDSERRAISRDDLPDVPAEPDHVVDLDDGGFSVDQLDVATDELIEFRIAGDDDHGIRADTRIDTGLLFPGESTFVIFDEADTYDVVDVNDEDHTMTVVATDPP